MKLISGLTNDYEKSNSITLPSYSQFCLQSKRRKWPRYGRDIITMTGESCSRKISRSGCFGPESIKGSSNDFERNTSDGDL
ncbi:hypothetical protein [Algoriphagus aquimarinus]|uniref:hypothetical protein n=1 Tax=Algoriphagus aquimarinus TaxID=237018 RepID=UPI0030DBC067